MPSDLKGRAAAGAIEAARAAAEATVAAAAASASSRGKVAAALAAAASVYFRYTAQAYHLKTHTWAFLESYGPSYDSKIPEIPRRPWGSSTWGLVSPMGAESFDSL